MPRKRRQVSEPTPPDYADKACKRTRNSYNRSKDEPFSHKRCTSWFREYAKYSNGDLNIIGPEGVEKFCQDLGVVPEDIVLLIIAWKMNAKQMGYFTIQEWLEGFTDLECDCMWKLQNKLDYMKQMLFDHTVFRNIYRYAYDFARDKDQRSMDLETAKTMLHLLLGQRWKLFEQFCKFLDQSKYKVINKDQWCNILEFSRSIHLNLNNYDLDGAWPVILDEFVEWFRSQESSPIIDCDM